MEFSFFCVFVFLYFCVFVFFTELQAYYVCRDEDNDQFSR